MSSKGDPLPLLHNNDNSTGWLARNSAHSVPWVGEGRRDGGNEELSDWLLQIEATTTYCSPTPLLLYKSLQLPGVLVSTHAKYTLTSHATASVQRQQGWAGLGRPAERPTNTWAGWLAGCLARSISSGLDRKAASSSFSVVKIDWRLDQLGIHIQGGVRIAPRLGIPTCIRTHTHTQPSSWESMASSHPRK